MSAFRSLCILILSGLLAACATRGPLLGEAPAADQRLEAKLARAAEQNEAGRALRDGVQALLAGDAEPANKAFSRALKLEPDNSQLHLLNAISYHLGYSRGVQINRDLAETGYLVALRLDPNNAIAAQMLGQLYLNAGRFSDARRWIGKSLLLGESSASSYQSLAVASYYTHDLPLALWAITQAERLDQQSVPILRAGALIRAATGQFEDADKHRQLYDAAEPDAFQRRRLAQRVAQWRTAVNELELAGSVTGKPLPRPVLLAQAAPGPGAGSPTATAPSSGPLAPNWSDCGAGTQAAGSASYGSSGATGNADETVQLPALPSPCAGRPLPRMAVIDVAIIRSQDTRRTSKGINLLDSLSLTLSGNLLNYARNWTNDRNAIGVDQRQSNRTMTVSLVNADSALSYSLNIANAVDQANEVIARPSLLVLDRQPSTFFSGSILSTVIAGSFSAGSRVDHPVGVSLSVTPTFVDDDSMLLSVKAGRSFFQDADKAAAAQSVQSTRNTASANVLIRFNETLALSGLSEHEIQENESGVPLLKEIPLLQYLFKTESTLNYNHSIMVLITPRRPENPGADPKKGASDRESPEVQELRARAVKGMKVTPNLDVIMASLEQHNPDNAGLYRQFRTGDLEAQIWYRPEGLQRIISEIADFLYY